MSIASDYQHILRLVTSWPAEQRRLLAKDILATVQTSPALVKSPRSTVDRALGLLRGEQSPPDDDDVKGIIHEHRMEKYG